MVEEWMIGKQKCQQVLKPETWKKCLIRQMSKLEGEIPRLWEFSELKIPTVKSSDASSKVLFTLAPKVIDQLRSSFLGKLGAA